MQKSHPPCDFASENAVDYWLNTGLTGRQLKALNSLDQFMMYCCTPWLEKSETLRYTIIT